MLKAAYLAGVLATAAGASAALATTYSCHEPRLWNRLGPIVATLTFEPDATTGSLEAYGVQYDTVELNFSPVGPMTHASLKNELVFRVASLVTDARGYYYVHLSYLSTASSPWAGQSKLLLCQKG